MPVRIPVLPLRGRRKAGPKESGLRWLEFGSTAVALGVLAQATLAGQILTGRHWLVATHRILAEVLPVLAAGLVLLGWKQRMIDPARAWLVWSLSAALVVLVAQTGLGFVGRSSPAAIAIHVPLGVALLGIYVVVATAARALRSPGWRRARGHGFEVAS
ncbi:hypothetical protein KSP35_20245 [Aquihabitans sp. G128]|uniref:hypothetical protein n=1 Tax=Aquihabitans sp. G128 TaxID=2849779 RepID=UPI001C220114|nr:hypothetical protein [Aquihabitans sp. G128]QXC60626.1 hypothetical protein KSP35_20245 [Aquihabitans sp. G128]